MCERNIAAANVCMCGEVKNVITTIRNDNIDTKANSQPYCVSVHSMSFVVYLLVYSAHTYEWKLQKNSIFIGHHCMCVAATALLLSQLCEGVHVFVRIVFLFRVAVCAWLLCSFAV